ncbi:hypothetical protein LIER_31969 [Lithospermum erythrorhizon]|uniref:Uncharacterized protein n=1 Tax=Lithospermum erythrorhizon TaxID=34254 RepID=A0AAV3RXW8_LITER
MYECGHSECSTSMDILVPAGIHGGARTQNGSLTERFRSGGRCNCGGWDVGCPLTVLSRESNGANISRQGDSPDECKTFDLFVERSPSLKHEVYRNR